MTKILSTDPSPIVAKQQVCGHCGATLEYVPADTRAKIVRDYLGDASTYIILDCPNCKNEITIDIR